MLIFTASKFEIRKNEEIIRPSSPRSPKEKTGG